MLPALFAHSGEVHQSSGQSFLHVVAAWYVLVPLFTIIITIVVAVVVRRILDHYVASHTKHHKKAAKEDS